MYDRFSLKDKVAIITGGAGFLAKIHIRALLEKKAKVILIDKNLKSLKKVFNLFGNNKSLKIYKGDITNLKSLEKINNLIIKKHKKIDILINNAANDFKINKKIKTKQEKNINIKNWKKDLEVNLTGSLNCIIVFSKSMLKKKSGVILNIASDLSIIGPDQGLYSHLKILKPVSYSVTKHGLIGMTKYFATLWSDKGIRINALSPGAIENNQDITFKNKLKKLIPMKRMGRAEEIKEIVQFLCSDASSYMTGQNVVLDGGRSIW